MIFSISAFEPALTASVFSNATVIVNVFPSAEITPLIVPPVASVIVIPVLPSIPTNVYPSSAVNTTVAV